MNTTDTSAASTGPIFSFRRMGGLDQVLLSTDEEWRQLDQLDPKLWMALSCPTSGLEFDARTLALLDTDHDGRIRSADILEAVAWVCERVKHPARLTQPSTGLPLDNLRDDTPQGAELLAAARLVQEKAAGPRPGKFLRSWPERPWPPSRTMLSTATGSCRRFPWTKGMSGPPASSAWVSR